MKIGIMGAHGTGKTGLAHRMAERLEGSTEIVGEVSRQCPFALNRETSREAQAWVFFSQIVAEIEAGGRSSNIICDRTALDAMVYSRAAGFDEQVMELLPLALSWFSTYDQVIFCRPDGRRAVAGDGFRDMDPGWQQQIDKLFDSWIFVYDLAVFKSRDGGHTWTGEWKVN